MRTAHQAYFFGAAAVAVSQGAGMVAGLLSLWLLAQILTKDMLGGYAFATSVIWLLALVATLGLDRAMLLRLAVLKERRDRLHGGGLALRTAVVVLAAGAALAAALALGAGWAVALGALPEAAFWLPALAPSVAVMAALFVVQRWYEANHRVPVSAVVPGLADLARSGLFAVVLLLGLGAAGVAASFLVAATVPLVVLMLMARGRARGSPRHFGRGDFTRGLQYLTLRLSIFGVRQIDLLMMGFLASGGATADYAVAARLALLADSANAALQPSFTPRARRHLALGDTAAVRREYDAARNLAFAGALAVAAGFALLGRPVLGVFGPFEQAYGPLLVLAAGYVVTAGAGMHGTYLAMTGEVGWSAALRSAVLALFLVLCLVLIPAYGAAGAAHAALMVSVVANGLGVALAYRLTGLRAVDPLGAAAIAAAVLALLLTAWGTVPSLAAAPVLVALALLPAWRGRRIAMEMASLSLARLLPGRPG